MMTTSKITRDYWIDKAKGWAEAKLSPPQADEFNAVMDEIRAENERLRAALAWYADEKNYLRGAPGENTLPVESLAPMWLCDVGERARKALKGGE